MVSLTPSSEPKVIYSYFYLKFGKNVPISFLSKVRQKCADKWVTEEQTFRLDAECVYERGLFNVLHHCSKRLSKSESADK